MEEWTGGVAGLAVAVSMLWEELGGRNGKTFVMAFLPLLPFDTLIPHTEVVTQT